MEVNIENDYKIITEALIKASNLTETEWLNIEKLTLESYSLGQSENARNNVLEMWNQLYRKVEESMERMKKYI